MISSNRGQQSSNCVRRPQPSSFGSKTTAKAMFIYLLARFYTLKTRYFHLLLTLNPTVIADQGSDAHPTKIARPLGQAR